MTNKPTKSKIPTFKTIQEEARFWDTHDITDFMDELEPVTVAPFRKKTKGITVRFDEKTLNDLRAKATHKGMGTTTLIRMWVMEKMNPPTQNGVGQQAYL